ncbi:unnamed protein product [Schistosoma margrebowiei]|uniref:NADH:ubiquinone oxidoreductase intermediate-associated protein 30 domain-containing protein n=1 Tax=Schistosoma margrebowiei TaxID=48269 RepID=A0A3P8FH79_9TREM|nr:unnamed protein product [Schistosoma margrebowiei]
MKFRLFHLRMTITNTSVAALILTTLLLNIGNALEEYTSQTDATQSSTISHSIMTYEVDDDSTAITLMQPSDSDNLTLLNFTDPETSLFEDWIEVSDTFRVEGRSKAVLVPHTAYNYQSAVFFYLLNPQPDGSGFAGVDYILDTWNLSKYTGVVIDLHRQGENSNFKLIFYGNCSEILNCQSYESFFETSGERQQIELPFNTFKPYFRGEPKPDSPPLDLTQLSRFGIQVFGGIFASKKQLGPGSIEIFTISAYEDGQMPV